MKLHYGKSAAVSVIHPGSKYMVVLGYPAKSRELDEDPLGPKSIEFLTKTKKAREADISRVFFIKEHLTGKKIKVAEKKKWISAFQEEVDLANPSRILVTEPDVVRELCDDFKSITEDHGTFFTWNGRMVIPTYRFSLSAQDPDFANIIKRDVERFFTLDPALDEPLPPYQIVDSVSAIPRKFWESKNLILDIETSGLEYSDTIHFIGLYSPKLNQVYILKGDPIEHYQLDMLERILQVNTHLILHNAKFDLGMLAAKSPGWMKFLNISDTMLLAHNAGEKTKSLKHLMSMYTNLAGSRGAGDVHSVDYLVQDLVGTWQIYQHFAAQDGTVSGHLMSQMSAIFGYIRTRGVYIDRQHLLTVRDNFGQHLQDVLSTMDAMAGIVPGSVNWNSTDQVIPVLLNMGIELKEKTEGGALSLAEAVLTGLALAEGEEGGICTTLLDYRGAQKLYTGFILPFLEKESDYVYPSLLLHGTETGRLSCKDPNLQQIPRKGPIKLAFRSRWPEGKWALVDLAQAELRGAALLSDDEVFAEALESEDAHRAIAAKIYHKAPEDITSTERKKSKGVTFSTLYGSTAKGISFKMGIPLKEAEEIQKGLFARFKKLQAWALSIEEMVHWAPKPFLFRTAFGRTRNLSTILHHEGPNGAYRKAINTGPQSLASDTMLWIGRASYNYLVQGGYRSRPLFPVHDSTMFEIYPGEDMVVVKAVNEAFQSLWESPLANYRLFKTLPFRGEVIIGETWAHCESTNESYKPYSITPVSSER